MKKKIVYSIVTAATSKLRQLPVSASLLFNIAAHTDQQLKQFKLSTLSLLLSLLSQKVLIQGVSTFALYVFHNLYFVFTNTLIPQISVIDAEDSTNSEDIVVKLATFVHEYTQEYYI